MAVFNYRMIIKFSLPLTQFLIKLSSSLKYRTRNATMQGSTHTDGDDTQILFARRDPQDNKTQFTVVLSDITDGF